MITTAMTQNEYSDLAITSRAFPTGPSVIVIGPDGVGKTTVVAKMHELTGIPTFKSPGEKRIFREGGRSSLAFDYNMTFFLGQTGFRFISDRGYPCEWVYSRVFKRDTDTQLLELIDTGHSIIGTKILYLYASVQPTEPDDIVPADKYWDVKDAYDRFAEWTSCELVKYDTAQSLHLKGNERAMFDTTSCMEMLKMEEFFP